MVMARLNSRTGTTMVQRHPRLIGGSKVATTKWRGGIDSGELSAGATEQAPTEASGGLPRADTLYVIVYSV
jgi:hypothetical protein